jgi:hypothetical protein
MAKWNVKRRAAKAGYPLTHLGFLPKDVYTTNLWREETCRRCRDQMKRAIKDGRR